MLLDNHIIYNQCISFLKKDINEIFENKLKFEIVNNDEKDHYISARYSFNDLIIEIEAFHDLFDIIIRDRSNAFCHLSYEYKYDSILNINNLRNAITLLKQMISNNCFPLYFKQNDKLYVKFNGSVKRIKHIGEYKNESN